MIYSDLIIGSKFQHDGVWYIKQTEGHASRYNSTGYAWFMPDDEVTL